MSIKSNEFDHVFCSLDEYKKQGLSVSSVWSDPDLLEAFSQALGCELEILFIKKHNVIQASLPVFYKKKYFLTSAYTPIQYYYHTISYYYDKKKRNQENIQSELLITQHLATVLRHRYSFIKLKFSPDFYDVRAFSWAKYCVSPLFTVMNNLEEGLEVSDFSYNQLKNIKKAQVLDLEINTRFSAEQALNLIKHSMDRKCLGSDARYKLYRDLIDRLYKSGKLDFFGIYHQAELVGFRMLLPDHTKGIVYDWLTGSNDFAYEQGANSLLLLHVLTHYKKNNFKTFDFCGANVSSVARYKLSFAGKMHVYYSINKMF